jgi:hypothetical protein
MVLPGSGGLLCIYKRHVESCNKETAGRSLPGNWAWYSPLKLDTVDQVWPENFGGVYKAPAVDLVSGVYMGVQEDAE